MGKYPGTISAGTYHLATIPRNWSPFRIPTHKLFRGLSYSRRCVLTTFWNGTPTLGAVAGTLRLHSKPQQPHSVWHTSCFAEREKKRFQSTKEHSYVAKGELFGGDHFTSMCFPLEHWISAFSPSKLLLEEFVRSFWGADILAIGALYIYILTSG